MVPLETMADGESKKTTPASDKDFSTALQFLVAEQRRIAAKRKKDEQFKQRQNYGYKLKVTLFAIIASGAGMLGAFILHDVMKDGLYGTLEKFIVGDKCGITAVPDNAGYAVPSSAGSTTSAGRPSSASCTARKITARVLYSLLALAIVVPIVVVVSRGKTTAEDEERKRIDALMQRKKLTEEVAR